MHIGIVILNWNTKSYLERFLPPLIESVEAFNDFANSRSAEIIVADSASTDGSIALVRSEFPSIRTIALDRNYGFTGGYNRAIKEIIDHSLDSIRFYHLNRSENRRVEVMGVETAFDVNDAIII